MTTLTGFFAALAGVFKFWDQVVWLVRTLQSTPSEEHDKLMLKLRAESDHFTQTGRPTWG